MLGLCYSVLLIMFLPYFGWTTQLQAIMDELQLSNTQAGMIASITSLVGGLALPFGGVLGDRIGLKKVIVAALIAGILGQSIFAWTIDFPLLVVGRALAGISVGLLIVGPYTLAVNWFRKSKQTGLALGVSLTTDGTGTMFALYAFALVLSVYGWREGLLISVGGLSVVLLAVILLLKDPPATTSNAEPQPRPDSLFSVLRSRNVIVAATFWVGTWGLYAMLSVWMPTILVEGTGMTPETAGFYTALYPLVGAVSAVTFGLIADQLKQRRGVVIFAGIGVTATMFALSFALLGENYTLVAALLPVLGLCGYTGGPVLMSMAIDSVGGQNAGASNGIVMGFAFIVGGFAYPFVLGILRDLSSDVTVGFFGISFATLLLCLFSGLFARNVKHETASNITKEKYELRLDR